jgi:hypothetical protein
VQSAVPCCAALLLCCSAAPALNKACGKIVIGDQSVNELLTIMRSLYLQESQQQRNCITRPAGILRPRLCDHRRRELVEHRRAGVIQVTRVTRRSRGKLSMGQTINL